MIQEIEERKSQFKATFGEDFEFMTYALNFHDLWRGRHIEGATLEDLKKEIDKTDKLWAPPPQFTGIQRCNRAYHPLLYVSNEAAVIPHELRLKEGDLFAAIHFHQIEEFFPLAIVGWDKLMNFKRFDLDKIIKDHFKGKSQEIVAMDRFLSGQFTQLKKTEESYIDSIAMTELHRESGQIGVIYPSVASNFNYVNLAIETTHAADKLEVGSAGIYELMELNNDGTIKLLPLSSAWINDDRSINWVNPSDSSEIIIS